VHLSCYGYSGDQPELVPENFTCNECSSEVPTQAVPLDLVSPTQVDLSPTHEDSPLPLPLPLTSEQAREQKATLRHQKRMEKRASKMAKDAVLEPQRKAACHAFEDDNAFELSMDFALTPEAKKPVYKFDDTTAPIALGELLFVEPDLRPGIFSHGGFGRCKFISPSGGTTTATVQYELDSRVEKGIPLHRLTSMSAVPETARAMTRSCILSAKAPDAPVKKRGRTEPLGQLWDEQKTMTEGWRRDQFDFYGDYPGGIPQGHDRQRKATKYPNEEHVHQFLEDVAAISACKQGEEESISY
jgi:hypothetical protein